MPLILGIDPGSRKTGYGIISTQSSRYEYVSSGVIRIPETHALPERLKVIFDSVCELIQIHTPQEFAIENVFMVQECRLGFKTGASPRRGDSGRSK